jgi:hypothetical protein
VVDIQTISVGIASASIVIGVVYYILQIQHQKKMRQTDLIMRTQPMFSISYREWREYMLHLPMDFKGYDDFVKKYGSFMSGKPEPETLLMLLSYLDMLGILVKRNLLSMDIVYDFYGMWALTMERLLMPLIEGFRKEWNVREFVNCEYLFSEMKKREQQLQVGAKNG